MASSTSSWTLSKRRSETPPAIFRFYTNKLLMLLVVSYTTLVLLPCSVTSYSHTLRIHRRFGDSSSQTRITPAIGYHRCLQAWRQENLGLWFLPSPQIICKGDADTGVGFVLQRIPPAALREGIVESCCKDPEKWEMTYQILNPGWFTWPVQEHQGSICFSNSDNESPGAATEMEWTVQWTPLSVPLILKGPLETILMTLTRIIVSRAADHIARDD
jgi:hypothetical protein